MKVQRLWIVSDLKDVMVKVYSYYEPGAYYFILSEFTKVGQIHEILELIVFSSYGGLGKPILMHMLARAAAAYIFKLWM